MCKVPAQLAPLERVSIIGHRKKFLPKYTVYTVNTKYEEIRIEEKINIVFGKPKSMSKIIVMLTAQYIVFHNTQSFIITDTYITFEIIYLMGFFPLSHVKNAQ
jgi:hypothetical protein